MILGLEIGMLVLGILALVKGKLTLSKSLVVEGVAARIAGFIFLLPIPLAFVVGFAIGFNQGLRGKAYDASQFQWTMIGVELACVAGCFVLGVVIALAVGGSSTGKRRSTREGSPTHSWRLGRLRQEEEIPEVLPCDEPVAAKRSPPSRGIQARSGKVPAAGLRSASLAPAGKKEQAAPEAPRRLPIGWIVAGAVLVGVVLIGVGLTFLYVVWTAEVDRQQALARQQAQLQVLQAESARAQAEAEMRRARAEADAAEMKRQEAARIKMRAEEAARAEQRRLEVLRLEKERQEKARRDAEEVAARADKTAEERLKRLSMTPIRLVIPASQPGTGSLTVTRSQGDGCTWASLPLARTGEAGSERPRVPALRNNVIGTAWAADGRSFYTLTGGGELRRFSYPGLQELRKISFKQPCQALAFCKLGLLITVLGLQELWLVDRDGLAVTRRFRISELDRVLTGPGLDVAYIYCRSTLTVGDGGWLPVRLSLEDGTLALLTLKPNPAVRPAVPFESRRCVALSPDGQWLFAGGGTLQRYRIDGTTVTPDASAPEEAESGARHPICVSSDGQWVCYPVGISGRDRRSAGNRVYHTADLSRPAFTFPLGEFPRVVGYDPVGKRIFAQDIVRPLLVYDQKGIKVGEHPLGKTRGGYNILQYAVHPSDGRTLLLRTGDELILVELTPAS
jgi:hypothetical protein